MSTAIAELLVATAALRPIELADVMEAAALQTGGRRSTRPRCGSWAGSSSFPMTPAPSGRCWPRTIDERHWSIQ